MQPQNYWSRACIIFVLPLGSAEMLEFAAIRTMTVISMLCELSDILIIQGRCSKSGKS